jgi:hypothetical protein
MGGPGNGGGLGIGGTFADLINTLKGLVQNASAINTTLTNTFPRISGTLTLSNATTTVVTQTGLTASSRVLLTQTNAAAALLLLGRGLYHSANTPSVSFTLSTQNGTAAGTETFEYVVVNPS